MVKRRKSKIQWPTEVIGSGPMGEEMIWNGLKDTKEETGLKHGGEGYLPPSVCGRESRLGWPYRKECLPGTGGRHETKGLCLMSVRKSKK